MIDKRSEAVKAQQKLFMLLGTIARTKITLEAMSRPAFGSWFSRPIKITPLEQRVLDAAAYVLADLDSRARGEMKNLPSKKNIKRISDGN